MIASMIHIVSNLNICSMEKEDMMMLAIIDKSNPASVSETYGGLDILVLTLSSPANVNIR